MWIKKAQHCVPECPTIDYPTMAHGTVEPICYHYIWRFFQPPFQSAELTADDQHALVPSPKTTNGVGFV
jgi:hypothetical protein